MGRFSELPQDVLWLIVRHEIKQLISNVPFGRYEFFEVGCSFPNPPYMLLYLNNISLINRACRRVVKSKLVWLKSSPKFQGWVLQKGALTI